MITVTQASRPRACVAFLLLLPCLLSNAATQDVKGFQYEDPSSNVEQISQLAGLTPLIERLKEVSRKHDTESTIQGLLLHQQILEHITVASLQADATIARIEGEVTQANEYRNVLSEKRDRIENRLNLAGIGTGGALGVVSSALQLSAKHARTGNSVGIGAGVIVTVLSVMSLKAQKGRPAPFAFRSNMLAPLLDRPIESVDVYSPGILGFLNAVPTADPDHLSRKQRLVRTWQEVGRLPDKTEKGREKINRLTELSGSPELTIDDLYDRRAMLEDLRAKLALIKRDLAALLMTLPQ